MNRPIIRKLVTVVEEIHREMGHEIARRLGRRQR